MYKIYCNRHGRYFTSDTNELPCDFFDVFKALDEKNVLFAAASGRQYFTLLNMLEPIKDKVLFIAENGTLVMYQGKELYSVTILSLRLTQLLMLYVTLKIAILCYAEKNQLTPKLKMNKLSKK